MEHTYELSNDILFTASKVILICPSLKHWCRFVCTQHLRERRAVCLFVHNGAGVTWSPLPSELRPASQSRNEAREGANALAPAHSDRKSFRAKRKSFRVHALQRVVRRFGVVAAVKGVIRSLVGSEQCAAPNWESFAPERLISTYRSPFSPYAGVYITKVKEKLIKDNSGPYPTLSYDSDKLFLIYRHLFIVADIFLNNSNKQR